MDLAAEMLQRPVDEVADMLLSRPTQHRYLLMRQLGHTGHSTVYAAIDQLLAREVALKLHHDKPDDDCERRILGEARTMSRVEHPNVVRVLDLGEHEGTMYSVTELCDADMTSWAEGKSWFAVVDRIREAGRGLAALHRAGYVHGDVKPANILVRDGVAKIGDFGMATRPGLSLRVGGTAGFIAPEAADGMRSAAVDVFALAATAWACLFGRPAFGFPPKGADRTAGSLVLIERAREGAIEEPPPAPVPRRIRAIVRRGLEPDPRRRPGLDSWLAQLTRARRRQPRLRRVASLMGVGGALVLLGAGGHAFYVAHVTRPVPVQPRVEVAPKFGPETVEQATELARRDDPLGVWGLYWPMQAEWAYVEPERTLGIAAILMVDAESGEADNPMISAEIAKRMANSVRIRALQTRDHASASQARRIVERCDGVLSRGKSQYRPD